MKQTHERMTMSDDIYTKKKFGGMSNDCKLEINVNKIKCIH